MKYALNKLDTSQNVYGKFVNMGTDYKLDNDEIPKTRNALVFLIVGMNGYWKLPIGYLLIVVVKSKVIC